MVFEKNLGSAKTFENAKALKGNIVASEVRYLSWEIISQESTLHQSIEQSEPTKIQ